MENLRQLHILRGIAALYVAVGHAKVVFWSGGNAYLKKFPLENWNLVDYILFALDMMSSAAQEFVIVFFVLSGFFIAYSFEKNQWKSTHFFINRLIRIYPPYLYSALLSVVVFLFIKAYTPQLFFGDFEKPIIERMARSFYELDLEAGIRALFFLPKEDYIAGNLSYWSLLPEWLFYLIAPFLVKRKPQVFILFAIFYFMAWFFRFDHGNHLLKFLFVYGFYFAIGLVSYQYIGKINLKRKLNKYVGYLLIIGLAIATIILGTLELEPYSDLVASLFAVSAIVVLLNYPIRNKLIFKSGTFLGDISYTLYVCHLPIYYFIFSIIVNITDTYLFYQRLYWLFIPIAILVSYLSYLLVEKRTLTLIKKFKSSLK